MGKIIETFGPCGQIDRRGLSGDEGASSRLDRDGARSRESIIRMPDGVEIDPEGDGNLSHGRHFLTGVDDACANSSEHLVSDLHVYRNAGWLDV